MIQNPSFRVLNFELSYTKFIYDPDIPIMSILIYNSNSIVYLKKKKKKKIIAQNIHPNFRIKSSKLGMSLTVHCLFQ